jgi:hypothetical protein
MDLPCLHGEIANRRVASGDFDCDDVRGNGGDVFSGASGGVVDVSGAGAGRVAHMGMGLAGIQFEGMD